MTTKLPLTSDRIVDAAIKLIEKDGLQSFSMRRLGHVLRCEAMSLYHHYPSKDHLLDAVLENVLAQYTGPDRSLPWREQLSSIARGYRHLAHSFPQFFQFLALHRMNTAAGLRFIEDMVSVFFDLGLDAETTARVFRSFSYYLTGALLDETAGYANGPSAAEPVPLEEQHLIAPRLLSMGPYFARAHWDATFELGLEMLLDGVERLCVAAQAL